MLISSERLCLFPANGYAYFQRTLHVEVKEMPIFCLLINKEREIIASSYNHTNESKNGSRHCELITIDKYLYGENYERMKNFNLIKCFNNSENSVENSLSSYFLYDRDYKKINEASPLRKNGESTENEEKRGNHMTTEKRSDSYLDMDMKGDTGDATADGKGDADSGEDRLYILQKKSEVREKMENLKNCCIVVTCEPCIMCVYALKLMGYTKIGTKQNETAAYDDLNVNYVDSGGCTQRSISLMKSFYRAGNPSGFSPYSGQNFARISRAHGGIRAYRASVPVWLFPKLRYNVLPIFSLRFFPLFSTRRKKEKIINIDFPQQSKFRRTPYFISQR
ncbi:cytidine and deoxycytidylate deaminase, putative [Plasmodium ovale wallikeri]|uniref:Cytidine and deoxycytidylate deaminase, putative n=1 Tax=Plasmodium ovale wallikeri TaxID=864142 RepID=A0A1A8Z923_PLAOA|nr:cytidine and deoxycytidylate deaminase, putative [Plasmodium ovale wallikeri]SBT40304.1 cytidine and deoxycytidylate deaminase, putative [Plasmodium ovale wallikeri]